MDDWEERLLQERADLSIKIEKLGAFITDSITFDSLTKEHKNLLRTQLNIMLQYAKVLSDRLMLTVCHEHTS